MEIYEILENMYEGQECMGCRNQIKPKSLHSLIVWNVSKALKCKPCNDLRCAIRAAQERLEHDSRDVDMMISQCPEQRHLACALLAWQQLGHCNADSLYEFIESTKKEKYSSRIDSGPEKRCFSDATCSWGTDSVSMGSCNMGPVVKLPTKTMNVMRIESIPCARSNKPRVQEKDLTNRIDAACYLESACLKRLSAVDKTTNDLRSRAIKLANRESERVELLERAEAAWRDLERGYQRRIGLCEEKEVDMAKQIQTLIDERNGNKNACTILAKQLNEKSNLAEKEGARLNKIEKDVHDRACARMGLSEEAARCDTALAGQQCRAAQLDRDLKFKEDQVRRKIMSLETEAESSRMLTHEAECAMRAELSALREQIAQVSNQLLNEDKDSSFTKIALEQLREEKKGLIEDLEGCKVICDNGMQGRIYELKSRREQLNSLKKKVIECRCKLPVDQSVQVKRTPSLAALCHCSTKDKVVESCSCISLRSSLLSNLLSDLFAGLQAELGTSGTQMPCQLLKCLENKHNWDRSSIIKTNLLNYFSKLLMEELDIAIAIVIEKYHAKWVGASCADQARLLSVTSEVENEERQERALERKAQILATQLAEQLFKERAKQLEMRVKDLVTSGPPPCECSPKTAAFTCLVKQNMHFKEGKTGLPAWQQNQLDGIVSRMQLEDLKKENECIDLPPSRNRVPSNLKENIQKENKTLDKKYLQKNLTPNKPTALRKKSLASAVFKKDRLKTLQPQTDNKPLKMHKKFKQEYAVNMCLCSNKNPKANKESKDLHNVMLNDEPKNPWKQKYSTDVISQISNIKQTKPITTHLPSSEWATLRSSKESAQISCLRNCVCFHKIPSNTSIDRLLETLVKWKSDLKCSEKNTNELPHQSILNNNDINIEISRNSCLNSFENNKENEKNLDYSKIMLNESKFSCGDKALKHNKVSKVKNILPPSTESEYMGAINLDKSNDNFCKCMKDVEAKDSTLSIQIQHLPHKCINAALCACKKHEKYKENMKKIDNTVLNQLQHSELSILTSEQNIQTDVKNELKDIIIKNTDPNNMMEKTLEISDKVKEDRFSGECPYYINFLGITLVGAPCDKENIGTCSNIAKINELKLQDKIITDTVILPKPVKTSKNLSNDASERNNSNDFNEIKSNFDCKAKLEEMKDFIRGIFGKKIEDISIQDESLDTTSMQLIRSLNNCICCNNFNLDDSRDLEENTFHLIEEHLKEKLDEYNVLFCKSSCISSVEQEKIFSVIIHRIKELISVSTKEAVCKCSDNEKTKGSWNRAYGLLQEYLKMKLKRVRCLCGPQSMNSDIMVSLDNVLERVYLLIEDDFDRLKKICHCNNVPEKRSIEINGSPYSDLPENNTNKSYNISAINEDIFNANTNNEKIIISKHNITSQVSKNLGMENKSCNAMDKTVKCIQTQNSDIQIFNESCKTSLCCCSKKLNDRSLSELMGTNELSVNHHTEIETVNKIVNSEILPQVLKKSSASLILGRTYLQDENKYSDTEKDVKNNTNYKSHAKIPYIGNTVDCSCEGKISSCVCMKSVIGTENEKIIRIWKMFTQKRVHKPNLSYIMHSTTERTGQEKTDIINLTTDIYANNFPEFNTLRENPHPLCNIKISAMHPNEDIVLKTSVENFYRSHRMTNTFGDNFTSDSSIIADVSGWPDCKGTDRSTISFNNGVQDIIISGVSKTINSGRSDSLNMVSTSLHLESKHCDCGIVPICHVKLLVESIENKLINMKCTCDSLIQKVCPVHGAKSFE